MSSFVGVMYGMLLNPRMCALMLSDNLTMGLVERYERQLAEKWGRPLEAWEKLTVGNGETPCLGYLVLVQDPTQARVLRCGTLATMPLVMDAITLARTFPEQTLRAVHDWNAFEVFCEQEHQRVRGDLLLVVDEEKSGELVPWMPGVGELATKVA
jgi:hypothetical protein